MPRSVSVARTSVKPLEGDYLTGEIFLQARLSSEPAPLNELVLALIHQTVRDGLSPGWITAAEIRRLAGA